jgi:hypothetical protein
MNEEESIARVSGYWRSGPFAIAPHGVRSMEMEHRSCRRWRVEQLRRRRERARNAAALDPWFSSSNDNRTQD